MPWRGNYQNAMDSLLRSKDQQAQVGAQYGQLGTETQLLGANDASGIGSAGQQQDQISQANLDANHNEWMRGQMWPFTQLQAMEGAGQMPNWGGMSSQSWSPYQNGYGQSPMGGMMQMLPLFMAFLKDGGAVDEAKPRRKKTRDRGALRRYAGGGDVSDKGDIDWLSQAKFQHALVNGENAAHPNSPDYTGPDAGRHRQEDRQTYHDWMGIWPEEEVYRDVKPMPRPVRRARGGPLSATPRQRPAGALRMAG
jgi:hypothetical protein